jgi:hypothetical protein
LSYHRFVRPNCARRPVRLAAQGARSGHGFPPRRPSGPPLQLRCCSQTFLGCLSGTPASPRIKLGGWGFQKINQPLRETPVFARAAIILCVAQKFLTILCVAL